MRLFVALQIPEAVRENLAAAQRQVQKKVQKDLQAGGMELRWVRPENFHMTLKFIGQASTEELAGIMEELGGVRPEGSVKATIRGLGYASHAKRGGVLWATMQASNSMQLLARQIDRRLERLGIPVEEHAFLPHLTLARCKQSSATPAIRAVVREYEGHDFGSMLWEEFQLMESRLGSGGSQYSTLASFRFAKAANA
ncbi:MAG: RNA 2',3'-cyclic phosphodiesterase [Candidatus Acidiferrum sp.]